MKIINGTVYNEDFCFEDKTVYTRGVLFSDCPQENDSETLDASGCYVIPGLIDLHFHGCMGADVCDGTPEALHTIAAWEAANGVTAICPATLTLSPDRLKAVLGNMADYSEKEHLPAEADLVGINMEGPFISHVKKGAQNGDYILPCSAALCEEFLEASRGLVKLTGLAPEENPDFEAYIRRMSGRVKISLAHTNADYDTAMRAFSAGACHAVHLMNAMPEFTHRSPGVVGAVFDSPHVTAEIICDGNHIHPSAVRAAFKLMGEDRMVLISDSLRAAGLGDGLMDLGGQEVRVEGTRATLTESGCLAGSVTGLLGCLQIVVRSMGIPLESAVRCASHNPAAVLGVRDRYGAIAPGLMANAVLLDKGDLSLRRVVKDGVLLP